VATERLAPPAAAGPGALLACPARGIVRIGQASISPVHLHRTDQVVPGSRLRIGERGRGDRAVREISRR
jgi:hypothetical protein